MILDKRLLCTAGAVAVVIGMSFMLTQKEPVPQEINSLQLDVHEEIKPAQEFQAEENVEAQGEYAYILKEYEGRLAVFSADSDKPQLVLNVLVKYLPDYDRELMRTGIKVKDYDELNTLIEDYSS